MTKPKPGTPWMQFVRAADQEVDSQLMDVNGNAAEAAHGVHDERQAATADRPGDGLHRIQNAGGGLSAPWPGGRCPGVPPAPHTWQSGVTGTVSFGKRGRDSRPWRRAMSPHALAVRTVGDDQQLVLGPDGAAQRGFHGIGAASRKKNGGVFAVQSGQLQKAVPDDGDHALVVILCPRCTSPEGMAWRTDSEVLSGPVRRR